MADDTNSCTPSLQLICTTCGSTMTFTPPVRKRIGTFIFRLGIALLILGFLLWLIHGAVEASWSDRHTRFSGTAEERLAWADYILGRGERPKPPGYIVCMQETIAPCFYVGLLLAVAGSIVHFIYDTKAPKAPPYPACLECKSRKSLIALNSPMGQKIYKDTHPSS